MIRRRYVAEAVGTFGIVFAPVAFTANGGEGGLLGAAVVSGLAVTGMIFAFGPISAAHFNPAVTLGFAAVRRFPWRHVPAYIASQVAGAIAAAALARAFYGPGGTHTFAGLPGTAFGTELVLSFLLMLVIVAVATDRRSGPTAPALGIGLTVLALVMVGGPVTGGSMNPARSLGPALLDGGQALGSVWLYVVSPPLGAVLAALMYERLRVEPEHAQDAPYLQTVTESLHQSA